MHLRSLVRVACGSVLLTALPMLDATPALSDILVTVDGERIETEGPWEVKGRQVLFTAKGGTLSAIRLSEVDLEASDLATNPPPPPPPSEQAARPRPQPVMVLTNEDVGRAGLHGLDDFSELFGTALQEMNRALDEASAKARDEPNQSPEERAALEEGLEILRDGLEELVEVLLEVSQRYPGLEDLDYDSQASIDEHADELIAAARELRTASHQAQSDGAREWLKHIASDIEKRVGRGG